MAVHVYRQQQLLPDRSQHTIEKKRSIRIKKKIRKIERVKSINKLARPLACLFWLAAFLFIFDVFNQLISRQVAADKTAIT